MLDSLQKCLRYCTIIAEVFKGLFNHALHVLLLCWVLCRLFDSEHFQCRFDSCPRQSGFLSFIQALFTVDVLLLTCSTEQYMYIH